MLVLPEKLSPGLRQPLIEAGSVPHRETGKKPGDVGRDCPNWLLENSLSEVPDLTRDSTGELHGSSIDPNRISGVAAKALESLPEGSARLGVRRLSPEQSRQLLPSVGTRLQDEIGE
jgi:hypothetical protein